MKVLRRLAALGAALAVSATLAVSASAAPAPPSPAQVTAAVVACLSHTNCAAALSRATGAIGVVNVDEDGDGPQPLDKAIDEIRRVPAIRQAWVVRLA